MSKYIGLLVMAGLTIMGIKTLWSSFETPDFKEITLQEIDSLGTAGLDYVLLTGGLSGGDYIYSTREDGGQIHGIKYPLVNMASMKSERDTSLFRTKVIIEDSKADSVSFGFPEIKGKVKSGKLSSEDRNLMQESYDLEDDYIVIKNGYTPPSKTFGWLLTLIPGFLLFVNLRIFFSKPDPNYSPEA